MDAKCLSGGYTGRGNNAWGINQVTPLYEDVMCENLGCCNCDVMVMTDNEGQHVERDIVMNDCWPMRLSWAVYEEGAGNGCCWLCALICSLGCSLGAL